MAILAKFLEEQSSFQATIFWYALNCVEPSLSYFKIKISLGLLVL